MRNAILRWMLIISAVIFADWIIMILAGCFSGICHAGNTFFCTVYCYFGIVLFSLSISLAVYFFTVRKKRLR